MEVFKILTYETAKKEVKYLLYFIDLVENYKIDSIEALIIHQYSLHNSISRVIKSIKNQNVDFDITLLTHDFIRQVILNKPNDELHSIIRKQYLIKTRPQRRTR